MSRKMTIIVIAMLMAMLTINIVVNWHESKYTVIITDKTRVTTQNGNSISSKYLIFGDDENGNSFVFEDVDTLFRLKFNSSDMYGQLKIGHTYDLTVVGFRIPLLSSYQNIVEFEER